MCKTSNIVHHSQNVLCADNRNSAIEILGIRIADDIDLGSQSRKSKQIIKSSLDINVSNFIELYELIEEIVTEVDIFISNIAAYMTTNIKYV